MPIDNWDTTREFLDELDDHPDPVPRSQPPEVRPLRKASAARRAVLRAVSLLRRLYCRVGMHEYTRGFAYTMHVDTEGFAQSSTTGTVAVCKRCKRMRWRFDRPR